MQMKLSRITKILIAASLSCSLNNVIAEDGSSSFKQALEENGWSVKRTSNGSLLLNARETTTVRTANSNNADSYWKRIQSELNALGWGVNREQNGSLILIPPEPVNVSTKNITDSQTGSEQAEWSNIQNRLQESGWKVDREADGSLILVPPAESAKQSEKSAKEIPDINLSVQMQQQLTNAGWLVEKNVDNSISLYPPEKPLLSQPEPDPGIAPTIELSLPVDSWQEAYDIANSWLDKQPPYNASVGKIRKIFRIYLVSIVSAQAPFNLIQQIAIRERDGAVIILN